MESYKARQSFFTLQLSAFILLLYGHKLQIYSLLEGDFGARNQVPLSVVRKEIHTKTISRQPIFRSLTPNIYLSIFPACFYKFPLRLVTRI